MFLFSNFRSFLYYFCIFLLCCWLTECVFRGLFQFTSSSFVLLSSIFLNFSYFSFYQTNFLATTSFNAKSVYSVIFLTPGIFPLKSSIFSSNFYDQNSDFLLFAEASEVKKCLYKILEIDRSASQKEIKKQYRKLSMKYHPDKNKSKDASERFKEIGSAYEILRSPEKRKIYDEEGHDGLERHATGQDMNDPFDIFSDFFGSASRGGHHRAEKAKSSAIVIKLRLTLEDLYFGKLVNVVLTRPVLCDKVDECIVKRRDCHGAGLRIVTQQVGPGFMVQNQMSDETCVDKGKGWSKKCSVCPNGLTELKKRTLTLIIEPGAVDQETISFESVGEEKVGYEAGDLKFIISTIPHERYTREGNNLRTSMHIDLLDALVGFKRTIYHIDKKPLSVSKDTITHQNDIIFVKGKGMPIKDKIEEMFEDYDEGRKKTAHGDLYLSFLVDFPESLSSEQKKLIKKALTGVATKPYKAGAV